MRFCSSSNPSTCNTLRTNGDKKFVRSSKKLLTYSGRLRSLSTINMGQSSSRVSSLACLQPKVSTRTPSPLTPPRLCTYGVLAHDQKPPQARGKKRAGRCPRHYRLMHRAPMAHPHRASPTRPHPHSYLHLLRITHAGNRHTRPASAWGPM